MVNIKVTGNPGLTVDGDSYSASVPVTAYDGNNTVIGQTSLIVIGLLSEGAALAANFVTRLRAAAANWKASVTVIEGLKVKLAKIVGMEL